MRMYEIFETGKKQDLTPLRPAKRKRTNKALTLNQAPT